jgi:UDP-N-acetylglucosamine 2-epimerase (non-hydrolysing)
VVDAVQDIAARLATRKLIPPLTAHFPKLPWRYLLVTAHRRENHGEHLKGIFRAIRELSERLPEFEFLFPVHPNPQVRKPAEEILGGVSAVHLLSPVDYVSFVWLMQHSSLILSDSGGVQEEAPSLGKAVLVMRSVTERPEGIPQGFIKLVGTRQEDIVSAVMETLQGGQERPRPGTNPYCDGHAAKRIIDVLKSLFEEPPAPVTGVAETYAHGR